MDFGTTGVRQMQLEIGMSRPEPVTGLVRSGGDSLTVEMRTLSMDWSTGRFENQVVVPENGSVTVLTRTWIGVGWL